MASPEESLRSRIANLEVDESVALAKRLPFDTATEDALIEAGAKLHNAARTAMARAKATTGHTYTGEAGNFLTHHGCNPVTVFVITRTA